MKIVKFEHLDYYGEMSTTIENWIEYVVFDATDEKGDSHVVNKEDCGKPRIEEI